MDGTISTRTEQTGMLSMDICLPSTWKERRQACIYARSIVFVGGGTWNILTATNSNVSYLALKSVVCGTDHVVGQSVTDPFLSVMQDSCHIFDGRSRITPSN